MNVAHELKHTKTPVWSCYTGCICKGSDQSSILFFLVFALPAERAIPFEHMMYEHLQKWGPRKQEVKFFLRHEDSPAESSDQGGRGHSVISCQCRISRNYRHPR